MNKISIFTLGVRGVARFYLARLREHLWWKPALSCVFSILAALVAGLADQIDVTGALPDISEKSIEVLLTVISASMLVIAMFAVGAMLSAYASASTSATPRSFPLVVADDMSQNALSTFIGAFIYSIVALGALLNGFYEHSGRFVLFLVTIFVFSLVIISFVRWVDRIARLGRLGNTVDKVEAATDAALRARARLPALGAKVATRIEQEGTPVFTKSVGYIQNIDLAKLQSVAEQIDSEISVCLILGSFVSPGEPLAYISKVDLSEAQVLDDAAEAFVIGGNRTFESDPRFGLIVLSEIASRALSPAVNDAGTAIGIIGTLVRLFVRWAQACEREDDHTVEFDRVAVPIVSLNDMFDDAFNAIARDGAGSIEVAIRLQKAFRSLAKLGHKEMEQAAIAHADHALKYAKHSLQLPAEYALVKKLSIATARK